ncbi:MAG: Transcriptional regulator, DeoR family [uncultured Thermomicrobiales bacterium]|uniref:Transcriptional regulator, DeoR family n=1 Tax=uncultured Thermomicrobiales bacterium TaxID=1645740 RepID=A0A6J4U6N1_9BACT|nr:MAG: Transcriptional regulator, DeoR family [uncultured Thermomicrobiales bacterium]
MYHPTTRVLAVLEMLQARQRVRGADIAERLEVDPRTVRRYITMLQDLGIPVESERGRHGAYVLRPGFKLPPLMLTEDEALAVVLGLETVRRLGLAAAAPSTAGAAAKIDRVLPDAIRQRVHAVQSALTLDLPPAVAISRSDLVLSMATAVHERRRVLLSHRAVTGTETERRLDPYGIVFRDGKWYAIGHCHLRDDLRVFRFDRITSVVVEDDHFARPAGFDPLAELARVFAYIPARWSCEVTVHALAEEVRGRISPTVGTLEPVRDGTLVRGDVESLDWYAHHLAGLPWRFRIDRPAELRDAVRELAERLLEDVSPATDVSTDPLPAPVPGSRGAVE